MAKVGIVTFHNAHNYGAVLQCFALQETLKAMGHDTEVINYSCDVIAKGYTDGSIKLRNHSIKDIIKSFILYVFKGKRKKKRFENFNNFINNRLNLSNKIEDKDSGDYSKYDSIIFGSDQIWNENLTDKDTFYFGNFDYNGNKVAYAASAGKGQVNLVNYFDYLKRFSCIGVREQSLRDFFTNHDFKNISINIDPTLLLSGTKWKNLLHLEKSSSGKREYVLVYPLRERTETVKAASGLAKRMGLDLIEIGAQVLFNRKKNRLEKIGPREFVELFYNSKYIVTNSFHGTVFAIIFNKDFNTIALNDGEDGRVKNLLKMLELDNRIIDMGESISSSSIDYSKVNHILNDMKIDSISYLTNNIGC